MRERLDGLDGSAGLTAPYRPEPPALIPDQIMLVVDVGIGTATCTNAVGGPDVDLFADGRPRIVGSIVFNCVIPGVTTGAINVNLDLQ